MTDELSVRPWTPTDFVALSALYEASVRTLGARGVARTLMERAETLVPLSGAGRLYAEPSETARPVFERLGYVVTGRRDFEVAGVSIHNWAVEKLL